jgi:hypothetical protein
MAHVILVTPGQDRPRGGPLWSSSTKVGDVLDLRRDTPGDWPSAALEVTAEERALD